MKPRISLQAAPGGLHAMLGLEQYIRQSGLEETLILLIKLRASQINGCAYCIDMHWKDARALGETEQRLYGLDAWQEVTYYTERERAALAWTEAVTLIADGHVSDSVYEEVKPHFSEKGTGRSDAGRGNHQCLEPYCDCIAGGGGQVPAGEISGTGKNGIRG